MEEASKQRHWASRALQADSQINVLPFQQMKYPDTFLLPMLSVCDSIQQKWTSKWGWVTAQILTVEIWHFGWEGKANWKQHTTFFITLMHINSFLQHYLPCPFRRRLASQNYILFCSEQHLPAPKPMPPAREFLCGPCTGLVFPKRDGLGVTQMLMISTTFQPSLSQWHRLQDDTNYCMRKGAAGLPIKAQNQQEQVHKCLAIQGEMKGQVYYEDRPARENILSVDQLYDPYIAMKTYILPVGFYFFFLKWKQTDSNILQEGFHLKNVYHEAHFLTAVIMWYCLVATAAESVK